MNKLISLSILTALGGCAVGPDYIPPQSAQPDAFYAAPSSANSIDASGAFWQGFKDPVLERLIANALADNHNLQAMLARYKGAHALLRNARLDQWPSLTAYAGASDQKLADVERAAVQRDELELYEAGAALHWELDFFGRLARATEARRAELQASGADLQALQVALVGQLASSYFELRGLQQQLQVMEQNVALQQSSLEIVSSRLKAGRGTRFDELRARAQLDATRAAIPTLQAAIRTNMHRLAVLTGRTPAALVDELAAPETLPVAMPVIPVGTPGELLRRRPDIRAAERRVAAATARIGIATADLFPRFTLTGLAGSLAGSGSDLFSSGTETRLVALGVDWTFLDFAQARARVDAADAEAEAALAEYRQAVLLALEETETWLVRYQQAQARVALLASARDAAEQAVAQARERYEQGYIDYFELLTAELELTRARDALAQARTGQALAMVNVYRSLAGPPAGEQQQALAQVSRS